MRAAIIVLVALVAVVTANNVVPWSYTNTGFGNNSAQFPYSVDLCGNVDCTINGGGCITNGTIPGGQVLRIWCSIVNGNPARRLRFNTDTNNVFGIDAGNVTITQGIQMALEHGTSQTAMYFHGVNLGPGGTLGPRTDVKRSQSYNVIMTSLTLNGATYTNTQSSSVQINSQFTCTGNGNTAFSVQQALFQGATSQTSCHSSSTGATYILAQVALSASNILAGTTLGIQAQANGGTSLTGTGSCLVSGGSALTFYSQPSSKKRGEERDPPIVIPGTGINFGGGGNGGTSPNPIIPNVKRAIGIPVNEEKRESEIISAPVTLAMTGGASWTMQYSNMFYQGGQVSFAVSTGCSAGGVTCSIPTGVTATVAAQVCPPINCGTAKNPLWMPSQQQCTSGGTCTPKTTSGTGTINL